MIRCEMSWGHPKELLASFEATRFHRRLVRIGLAFALLRIQLTRKDQQETHHRRGQRDGCEAPMNLKPVREKRKLSIDHDVPLTRLIAGVSVPDTPLITAVIEHAQRLSEPYLFNHAMRSWLFAETIGRIKGIDFDREVVAVGTILHHIRLTATLTWPNRFALTVP